MSRNDDLKPIHLRYKGVFDFQGLLKLIHKWYLDRKYRTQEDKYKNKPDSPWGYEHELKLSGTKKVDAFYKYGVKVFIHVRDGQEIVVNGKNLMNGRIEIVISGTITRDYENKFTGNKFKEGLGSLYMLMTKREFELLHWDVMHYKLHRFQEDMKKHLNMYTDVNW